MTTDLVASYWTIAGNTLPLSVDTPSPVAIELRAEAAARAGFSGLGLYHADLMHLRREPGFAELRRIL
jgi:hypothetical protein